jgi:hypothetical protein
MTEYKIPLRNRNKEIIDYCLVSKEDFEHLNTFRWSNNSYGYAQSTFNGKTWKMHRYIISILMNNKLDVHMHVDHINKNRLDNRRENLRLVTQKENNANRTRREGTSSKYLYVIWCEDRKKWCASIKDFKLYAYYESEIHAAYQVNLWIEKYKLDSSKLNDIQPPEDFCEYKPKKNSTLPTGISIRNNNYRVVFCHDKKTINLGTFSTLEEAIKVRKTKEDEINKIKEETLKNTPITRNENGDCVLRIYNKKTNKTVETLVDEDLYYDLIKYTWWVHSAGYICSEINKKSILLARYVMNYFGKDIVDHINSNILDNRRANLRIATRQQNSMNRSSVKNSTSQYIGVSYDKCKGKFVAKIQLDGKNRFLGIYENEEEAAKVRDEATKKYYGEFGKLNFK